MLSRKGKNASDESETPFSVAKKADLSESERGSGTAVKFSSQCFSSGSVKSPETENSKKQKERVDFVREHRLKHSQTMHEPSMYRTRAFTRSWRLVVGLKGSASTLGCCLR